jgi:hypothetical protein
VRRLPIVLGAFAIVAFTVVIWKFGVKPLVDQERATRPKRYPRPSEGDEDAYVRGIIVEGDAGDISAAEADDFPIRGSYVKPPA